MNPPTESRGWFLDSVLGGVLLTLVLHAIVFGTLAAACLPLGYDGVFWGSGMAIGLVQLPYIAIADVGLHSKRLRAAKGVLIGAGVTFLLNAACFGVVLVGVSGLP